MRAATNTKWLQLDSEPRLQLDLDDEDDLFADPKVTTPGLQTQRIVLPLLANLNHVDDAGEEKQDNASTHHPDQEEELEKPWCPEDTEDPPVLALRKKPTIGKRASPPNPLQLSQEASRLQSLPPRSTRSLAKSPHLQKSPPTRFCAPQLLLQTTNPKEARRTNPAAPKTCCNGRIHSGGLANHHCGDTST
jgi:hypothetical protein